MHLRYTATASRGRGGYRRTLGSSGADGWGGQRLHSTALAGCRGRVLYHKTLQGGGGIFSTPRCRGGLACKGTHWGPLYPPLKGGGSRAGGGGARRTLLDARGPLGLRRRQGKGCALFYPLPRTLSFITWFSRAYIASDRPRSLELCPCPESTTPLSWKGASCRLLSQTD